MATGERIRFFRNLRGMTLKYLGLVLGFPENSADVRMAQYECEDRTPKADLTAAMAEALEVSPKAITVPDIDSMDGLMHTLFALEDRNLIRITEVDGVTCLRAAIFDGGIPAAELEQRFNAWQKQAAMLSAEEITKEEYDRWRYLYPKFDDTKLRVQVPPDVSARKKRGRKPRAHSVG
ncbi:MAG: helix-turn-helix transcriptional regulator [Clostridia bacterium]|nr:helix-turn-helix transcriptional regulator [Clostridia bacterium]